MTLTLTLETTIGRAATMITSDLGDETVMMNIDKGIYHGLNETGTRIWMHLAQPLTVRELCERLVSEFPVAMAQCEREVVTFLGELLTRDVIRMA
jgi:hypothetical protein